VRGTRHIAGITAILLVAGMAFGQGRRQRGGPSQRLAPAPHAAQSQAPPPQQQQPPNQQQNQQRPGFDRFILHGPGPHASDWLRNHEDLSLAEQKKALEADPQYQRLSPEGQQKLLQRLDHFNSLPPAQRDRIMQRMETLEHLSPQDREKARGLFSSFRQLPTARRSQLNFALRDLRAMSPDDRMRALDSNEYKARFTDQERDLLRGMSEMELVPRRGPGE
jgi:hypothetical protein